MKIKAEMAISSVKQTFTKMAGSAGIAPTTNLLTDARSTTDLSSRHSSVVT